MGFEELDQRASVGIKPLFEGMPSGEGRRWGDLGVFKLRFKARQVRPDPVWGRRRWAGDWVRHPYHDRDMVRPSGGEVTCPFLEERPQGMGRECEV